MPSPKTTTTQTSAPWQPAQAPLKDVASKAEKLGNKTSLFKPIMGTDSRAALNQLEGVARAGSEATPVLQNVVGGSSQGFDTGLGQLTATANGENLNGNPYMRAALDRAANATANDVNQQFAASGRYGSANHAGTIADRVGALRQQAEMENYGTERQNQLAAGNTLYGGGFQGAGMAGEIDKSRLLMPSVLQGVGAQRDAFDMANKQAPLTAAEWQKNMSLPLGQMGSTSTGTQTTSNPMGTAMGALTTGLGLLSAIPTGGASLGLMGALGGGAGLMSSLAPIAGRTISGTPGGFNMGL
jgi:hypothetical protein